MINIYTWTDGTELYHHGIIGQKWGIRRYQNADGSLTAAGRRRRRREELRTAKENKKESQKPKKMKDMSDDELRTYKSRLQLEKDVIDLENQINGSTSMKDVKKNKFISDGKDFVLSTGKYIVGEAVKSAGKSWLEKKLKDKLKLNDKSELEKLKAAYQTLDYKKKIENLKSNNSNKKDELQEDISDLIKQIMEEENKK